MRSFLGLVECHFFRFGEMFSLLTKIGLARSLRSELLPFAIALVIAQLFFKWGSFSLELLGFLALWGVLGFVFDMVIQSSDRD